MIPSPTAMLWRARRVLDKLEHGWPQMTLFARFSDDPFALMGLAPDALYGTLPQGPELHDAAAQGIARCPLSWDPVQQRDTDPGCPTCYGVGWTGGYHRPGVGLRMWITEGDFDVTDRATGETIRIAGLLGLYLPRFLVLPQDLVLRNDTGERFEVGLGVKEAGIPGIPVGRAVQLLPLVKSHPGRRVPMAAVGS